MDYGQQIVGDGLQIVGDGPQIVGDGLQIVGLILLNILRPLFCALTLGSTDSWRWSS